MNSEDQNDGIEPKDRFMFLPGDPVSQGLRLEPKEYPYKKAVLHALIVAVVIVTAFQVRLFAEGISPNLWLDSLVWYGIAMLILACLIVPLFCYVALLRNLSRDKYLRRMRGR